MAGGRCTLMATALLLIACVSLHSATAMTFNVGGQDSTWTFQNVNPAFYDDWAAKQTFQVGDQLVFLFQETIHDVIEVSKADLTSCATGSPLASYTKTNSTVTLSKSGYHGFICSISGHCSAGMKINLQVADASGAPSPAVSTPPPTSAPTTTTPGTAPDRSPAASSNVPTRSPSMLPPSAPTPNTLAPQQNGGASTHHTSSAVITGAMLICLAGLFFRDI